MSSISLVIGFGDKLVEIELGSAIRTVDDTVPIRAGSPRSMSYRLRGTIFNESPAALFLALRHQATGTSVASRQITAQS
jgi:hypothetical protein